MTDHGEATVGTLDGHGLRARFPLYATVFGVEAVVIPAAEFARLRSIEMETVRPDRKPRRPEAPSTLDDQDPEVAAFVRGRLAEGLAIWRIQDAARRAFGNDRAPTWGAIRRYRLKVLEAAKAQGSAST